MRCVHSTRAVDGFDYNRETADRALVDRTLRVPAPGGESVTLEMQLPAYIADKLKSHHWDRITFRLAKFCQLKLPEARLLGVPRELFMALLGAAAKGAIYDEFTGAQIEAGNDAWAVPMVLEGRKYPGVVNG
jgi:hypothetical protein